MSLLPSSPGEQTISIISDIPYLTSDLISSHSRHKLDIYLPTNYLSTPNANQSIPVVLIVHGGGWQRGSKDNEWRGAPSVARSIAKAGFIAVSVGYRLARPSVFSILLRSTILSLLAAIPISLLTSYMYGYSFLSCIPVIFIFLYLFYSRYRYNHSSPIMIPSMMDDLAQSIIFIRQSLHRYSNGWGDLNSLFLVGHSAAAHLVALMMLNRQYAHLIEFENQNRVQSNNNKSSAVVDEIENPSDDSEAAATVRSAALSAALNENSSQSASLNSAVNSIRGVISISGIYNLYNPMSSNPYYYRNIIFRLIYSSAICGSINAKDLLKISPISYVFPQTNKNHQNNINGNGNNTNSSTKYMENSSDSSNHNNPIESAAESNSYSSFSPSPTADSPLIYKPSPSNSRIDSIIKSLSTELPRQCFNNSPPPFLVINAASDLGLEYDGIHFSHTLYNNQYNIQYIQIPNTNHATIVNKFEKHEGKEILIKFIKKFHSASNGNNNNNNNNNNKENNNNENGNGNRNSDSNSNNSNSNNSENELLHHR